jgi:transposase-like protein
LAEWVAALGTGTTTASSTTPTDTSASGRAESQAAKLARLESRIRELEAEKVKLSTEREILRSAAKYFAGEDELVSRFEFVADHRDTFEVKQLCTTIEISRSSYYAWQ